jgi:hypothetical protein
MQASSQESLSTSTRSVRSGQVKTSAAEFDCDESVLESFLMSDSFRFRPLTGVASMQASAAWGSRGCVQTPFDRKSNAARFLDDTRPRNNLASDAS